MPFPQQPPLGDETREAIDSLRGYAYQIYQSALAWTYLGFDEILYLEVAEDYAVAAAHALRAVQVKDTTGTVTINSDGIVASIDSFVDLLERNPGVTVSLRHLTTSKIGKEKKAEHRINDRPTLESWRSLAKAGDLSELRRVLGNSKLANKTKSYVASLDDKGLRENFLRRIHFDCGAPDTTLLKRQIDSRVTRLLFERDGLPSQVQNCIAVILLSILELSTKSDPNERLVTRADLERHLERATQITLNRAQFEAQNRQVARALSSPLTSENRLSGETNLKPSPVSEVPLPPALAKRENDINNMLLCLEKFGSCWITGAAGMGKTVAARVLAHELDGAWGSINMRGLAKEHAARALLDMANTLPDYGLRGLIIDDLEQTVDTSILGNLIYLFYSAGRSDVLLIITAPSGPTSDFLFALGLQTDISVVLAEFSENDLVEILEKLEVPESQKWAHYTYIISGGGHPQLAMAFIQSMAARGWDPSEFETLNSLVEGSPAIIEVRRRTRERLLKDLPEASRRMIERLSLKIGGFSRGLALDLGRFAPPIHDAGIILDSLIGSWIDQHEGDRFSLSPLLTDYATNSLAHEERQEIQSAIAESLTKGRTLSVIDLNAALIAARNSNNKSVVVKICLILLNADQDKIEMLAPHLSMFTLFRTDIAPYPDDPTASHMFRGVQLLLLSQADKPQELRKALERFSVEAENTQNVVMRELMNLLVYSKLLMQPAKSVLGSDFLGIISKLGRILENKDSILPEEAVEGLRELKNKEGVDPVSFLFVNQTRQLARIVDLVPVFDFLDSASSEYRAKLLETFDNDDFSIDLMVAGAWLNEHEKGTIDPNEHCRIYGLLEQKAAGWGRNDLAVSCRKYWAVILDEYGNDANSAIEVLDEGLGIYGQTNYELVRAKAKVLYRSDDHKGSLALSKTLIEGGSPLSTIEKAFLGRDAAISAEKQADFKTARRYYLYGSEAAGKSDLSDMEAMRVGLLADAALASWHDGDKLKCLQDFVGVLSALSRFTAEETLRTAHCHAITRHAVLWLDQEASGEVHLIDGLEQTKIYPGCVSNPEPHSQIKERSVPPIEMSWYMLARIENYLTIDAGISQNLDKYLPKGPVLEGQVLLAPAKMHNAMMRLDAKLFVKALKGTIACSVFTQARRASGQFSFMNPTYQTMPIATKEQQKRYIHISEQFVLLFYAMCVLKENITPIADAVRELNSSNGCEVRPEILGWIKINEKNNDFNIGFSMLILKMANSINHNNIPPREVFEVAFKVLSMAKSVGHFDIFCEILLPWLEKRWNFIWQRQRFLLVQPMKYQQAIEDAISQLHDSHCLRVINFLSAFLPTLNVSNQEEVLEILSDWTANH
jgi:phosphoribosyl-ATP pyrophosphohydrolase